MTKKEKFIRAYKKMKAKKMKDLVADRAEVQHNQTQTRMFISELQNRYNTGKSVVSL